MAELRDKFEAANIIAMWDQELRPNLPLVPSHIWHWNEMTPLLDQSAKEVSMDDAERRVLILRNPGLTGARSGAAPNLSVNLQVLMPGEKARPHRHTMHALRFVLEGSNATTVVEGKPCPMLPGDLVLTPGMTWHEHINEGNDRSVWVDALDVPIHGFLENRVFEPGPVRNMAAPPADAVFAAGLGPAKPFANPWGGSPMFRYPWETTAKALDAMTPEADGSRRLRYVNPTTGGAVLSTIDCYVLGLTKGAETTAYRTNSNAACVVVDGEGQSRVGDDTINWGPKDIFILPHGQWISHRAGSDKARLFQITDRELFRRLDFLRDETRH